MNQEALLIIGMMAVTFGIRYFPFAFAGRIRLRGWLLEALSYVPICVLAAIVAPAALMPSGTLDLGWSNSYLVAALVSVAVAAKWKNLLATILTGMAAFFLVQAWGL